ncbi:MAG: VirB8/TrbF family protein [Cetobacterium sp.]|uniref:VirB8/TrbF family protein n=1 Tax=Cetobacterium sp. TaxID=2071632 RepID=UPI003EE4D33D
MFMFRWKPKKTPLEINGQQILDNEYLKMAENADNWRKTTFSLLIICAVLVFGLIYTSRKNSVETFVLEKNGNNYKILGNIQDLTRTQNSATDEQIIYFLNQFVMKSKFLPSDLDIYERNYTQILSLMTQTTSKKLDKYLIDEKYEEKIRKGQTVEIILNTALRLERNSYQVRWTQRIFNKSGELIGAKNYLGVFTIKFGGIKDKETLINNPLGIIITNFIQSEENL